MTCGVDAAGALGAIDTDLENGPLPRVKPHSNSRLRSLIARIQPWIQASRPAAFPMIFIPMLLGKGFAFAADGQLDPAFLLPALLFAVFFQVHLLYTNDHRDESTDRANDQYWLSGGSRVLPQGKLESKDLSMGARIALGLLIALALFMALCADRPWMVAATLSAVALSWAYNRPPLELSYRGYGEVLQGLGCGVLLPLIGFYLQQGNLDWFPWLALVPLYLLFHAGNIVTALPDYRSDKAGGKRTFPVRNSEQAARNTAWRLLGVAALGVALLAEPVPWHQRALIAVPAGLVLAGIAGAGWLQNADADDFPACKSFVTWASLSQAWLLCAWIAVLLTGEHR
jgi:1,4-dihydroxy-2-naphthoate octaprenyltransferase